MTQDLKATRTRLVLSLCRGRSFWLDNGDDNVRFSVETVYTGHRFTLRRHGDIDLIFEVNVGVRVEIFKDVFVRANKGTSKWAVVVIEAPRAVRIDRMDEHE